MLGVQQQLSPGGSSTVKVPPTNECINMEELRKDCWLGIPHKIRPLAWRILSVKKFCFLNKGKIHLFIL